ncbi:MAG: aminodeoxychorismate synthase component I [Myxococcaceae bacterium]|nr:aminodeoxychorismate synthase component I [Myxococcaceae bacterium]MCI0670468.1 aminodeoxychorismate synthase component I [Myxococcaceae bacterium]
MLDAPLLVFDFPDGGTPRRRVFADPVEVLVAHSSDEVRRVLRIVERASASGLYSAGYVSYEAAPAFDAALRVSPGAKLPLAWFGLFRAPTGPEALPAPGPASFSTWKPSIGSDAYRRGIDAIREAIAAGETYQLNYTLRLRAHLEGDDLGAWTQLCSAQGAAYGAYLRLGRHRILSASPELFFRLEGRHVTTRPMKGTVRRGRWEEEDVANAAWLAGSEKNRAENAMIVDLLRNDLGRVAQVGTVRVPRLFDVERYRTVLQMTSTIEAELPPEVGLDALFAALFPCGSITGAPKVRTMELIAALEDTPREVYCGAIGLVEPGGNATFSVAIRTVWLDAETGLAEYGTGGGITWDSTAADEYEEALAKAQVLTEQWPDFSLLETLRLEAGAYALRGRHLARLASSARYFGIPLSPGVAEEALDAHARAHPVEARRVRLLVAQDGTVRAESEPLRPLPEGPLPVALARTPVSRHNRFLFHKTTHRPAYEARRREHPDAFDVVLWNEEGELTELTNGNLVVELEGRLWTPARDCGLLTGTLREELLAKGELSERVLTRDDLARAKRMWLINSVRGWVTLALSSG